MSQFISLEQAVQMTTSYRENRNKILNPEYAGATILPNAETINRSFFDQLLAQNGCEAIRIYYGMDAELKVHAVIVGVNGKNEDMLPPVSSISRSTENNDNFKIIDRSDRCPDICPPESPLNP